jgi:hypothetical protein
MSPHAPLVDSWLVDSVDYEWQDNDPPKYLSYAVDPDST